MSERIRASPRDPTYNDTHIENSHAGLNFVDPALSQEWAVKLRFVQTDGKKHGSGFYVNIPGVRHDVILTAGHNLIDEHGQLSRNITVLGRTPDEDIPVGNSYHICDDYIKTPQSSNAVKDYGIILLPQTNKPGFGFSLKLAYVDDLEGEVRVTGYRDDTPAGSPITSSGSYICTEDQIVYKASTEQGISGSAVWVAYEGFETVVAIHNHRPKSAGTGSRGTRLNLNVLMDVFKWANVGWLSKVIKVSDQSPHIGGNLYLQFSENSLEARVRVSTDGSGVDTRFNILPAHSWPTTAKKLSLYVFTLEEPAMLKEERGKWVSWNPEAQEVVLVNELRESCLVRVQEDDKSSMRIIRVVGKDLMDVRMAATRITEDEIMLGIEETSEVSFGKYVKRSKIPVKYNKICFVGVEL
ncbi:hypothetical protein TWF217_003782 [Orbilia oligospora]|nr:hypothetical protein TWF217_003782 [Orbilia oligospora]